MTGGTARDARRFLAEEIRVTANISPPIVDALATVPRERFLPPGPWQIRGINDVGGPRRTEDADPRRVYHDVSIAIDPDRNLYNGQPSLVARWLEVLQLRPGDHVVHIGCGTGYFSALIAHIVGPAGRVQAMEIDAELAASARENLSEYSWVEVCHGHGASGLMADADRILVHAGATHILDAWLDALAGGGRLLLPLTVEFPGMPTSIGKGMMLLITRQGEEWLAQPHGAQPVAIYSLKEIRDAALNASIVQAMTTGALVRAARVRRDSHEPTSSCIVHSATNCLSG